LAEHFDHCVSVRLDTSPSSIGLAKADATIGIVAANQKKAPAAS
jgi:hypothetical protein